MRRLSLSLLLIPTVLPAADRLDFNRDVRPILSDKCFACHGPDKSKRKADLRLDTPAGKAVVVPGELANSELVKRITSTDKDEMMPPPSSGRSLTAKEKDVLKTWIAEGAEWQPHWAYVVPKWTEPPAVTDPAWTRNPIDRFVLARLERDGLKPSPDASRHTPVRRLALAPTG